MALKPFFALWGAPMRRLSPWILAIVFWSCGCASLDTPIRQPPSYLRVADHYRSFEDADGLARYLRADSESGPLVIAHRGGAASAYPENALATFDRALRYGPILIECDLRITQDGVPVVFRNETLDGVTTGKGAVAHVSFAAIRKHLLLDAFGALTPFRVPSLGEVLAWAEGRTILMLDVKSGVPLPLVLDFVAHRQAENRVIIMASDMAHALEIHRRYPAFMIAAPAGTPEELDVLLARGIDPTRLIVLAGVTEVNPEIVAASHVHNIRVMLGTMGIVDERAQTGGVAVYQALFDRGIDIIVTDAVPLASTAAHAIIRGKSSDTR